MPQPHAAPCWQLAPVRGLSRCRSRRPACSTVWPTSPDATACAGARVMSPGRSGRPDVAPARRRQRRLRAGRAARRSRRYHCGRAGPPAGRRAKAERLDGSGGHGSREGGSARVALRESASISMSARMLLRSRLVRVGTLITDEERDRRRDHGLKQVGHGRRSLSRSSPPMSGWPGNGSTGAWSLKKWSCQPP